MAILGPNELCALRQAVARRGAVPVNYTKAQIDAAVQAVEDFFEANRAGMSTAINTATAPLVLTVAQKKELVRQWLIHKFNAGG